LVDVIRLRRRSCAEKERNEGEKKATGARTLNRRALPALSAEIRYLYLYITHIYYYCAFLQRTASTKELHKHDFDIFTVWYDLIYNLRRGPLLTFMYQKPILWTLYNALDFLKVLKIAVVGGGVLLVHSAYIMSLLMMAGIKYWDVMYTLCPS